MEMLFWIYHDLDDCGGRYRDGITDAELLLGAK